MYVVPISFGTFLFLGLGVLGLMIVLGIAHNMPTGYETQNDKRWNAMQRRIKEQRREAFLKFLRLR